MSARFTTSTQEALQRAQAEAIRRENQDLHPEHVLNAFLEEENEEAAVVPNILQLAGVNLAALKARIKKDLDRLPKVSGG